jgi:hypothetical protein
MNLKIFTFCDRFLLKSITIYNLFNKTLCICCVWVCIEISFDISFYFSKKISDRNVEWWRSNGNFFAKYDCSVYRSWVKHSHIDLRSSTLHCITTHNGINTIISDGGWGSQLYYKRFVYLKRLVFQVSFVRVLFLTTVQKEEYELKKIDFLGRKVPIVMQNKNGPCPLIAIGKVTLLASSSFTHLQQQMFCSCEAQ